MRNLDKPDLQSGAAAFVVPADHCWDDQVFFVYHGTFLFYINVYWVITLCEALYWAIYMH